MTVEVGMRKKYHGAIGVMSFKYSILDADDLNFGIQYPESSIQYHLVKHGQSYGHRIIRAKRTFQYYEPKTLQS